MYIKIYESELSVLLAVCDRELIGKTVQGCGIKLEISEDFYKGELVDIPQVQAALMEATTANITGERSIEAAISCGAIDTDSVMDIGGVPHAQMFSV